MSHSPSYHGCIIKQVERTLFRPHILFLRRYCQLFDDMMSLDGPQSHGKDDSSPIVLQNVQIGENIYEEVTAEAFELAMRVIYPE